METHAFALKQNKKSMIVYLHSLKIVSKLQLQSLMEKSKTNSFESNSNDSLSTFVKSYSPQVSWNENYQNLFEPSAASLSWNILCERCNCAFDKDANIICIWCDTNRIYNESLKTGQSKNNVSLTSNEEDSSNIALISQKSNSKLLSEEQSLDLTEGELSVSNVEKDGSLSLDFLRDARVNYFLQNTQIPIRYRHFIWSPSFFKNYTLEINFGKTEGEEERLDCSKFVKEIFRWYSSNVRNFILEVF